MDKIKTHQNVSQDKRSQSLLLRCLPGTRGTRTKKAFGLTYAGYDAPMRTAVSEYYVRPRICKICGRGTMVRKKVYRMPLPFVLVGFILLIPSTIGIAACIIGLSAGAFTAAFYGTPSDKTAMIFDGGASIVVLASFVGCLLGWPLVLKRWVLQCSKCGARCPTHRM